MTIGILGGYGDVGAQAARRLVSLGVGPLRIGGRNLEAARRFAKELSVGAVEHRAVDFRDDASLRRFVGGCRIVLNCAGPSHAIADRAARAAVEAGADYVDAAGDDALYALLDDEAYRTRGRVAVLSAGLQPGLTALLPRWAAQRAFSQVHGMRSYFGVLDRFTEVAADDYLQAATDGVSEPLAAWREGRRSGVLTRTRNVEVPFFPGPATLLPYLNTEGERLAASLRLARGDWYTVITGQHILTAFDRARSLERREAVAALCRASLLDLAGREPHVLLVAQLDGLRDGAPVTRTLVMRGRRNAELTGTLAALTTLAVDQGQVPAGRHFAAAALEPLSTVGRLRESGAVTALDLLDTSIDALGATEEGSL
ncbi:saccharopine dehydrogenase NADP-binding domain-containing protein [Sorangium sp. So ce117]|uniref:saccharopine dehydrogenase NADP-binding domain-containing protein n=1 Tax=Sorangium sp. So ce117 TaxID=3133277 RepID=UPI003F6052F3